MSFFLNNEKKIILVTISPLFIMILFIQIQLSIIFSNNEKSASFRKHGIVIFLNNRLLVGQVLLFISPCNLYT